MDLMSASSLSSSSSHFMLLPTEAAEACDNEHLLLRQEVEALRSALASETERCAQLGAELARVHEANFAGGAMHQLRVERDAYKQKLEDQLKFKRGPLEARLLEANRVLFEQRLQFRSIVDVLAAQRDWVREWALQCQENLRLKEALERREAGAEAAELRRVVLEAQAKCAELAVAAGQRDAVIAVHESKARSLALENQRLASENELHKEQIRRLWLRVEKGGAGRRSFSADNDKEESGADDGLRRRVKRSRAPNDDGAGAAGSGACVVGGNQ